MPSRLAVLHRSRCWKQVSIALPVALLLSLVIQQTASAHVKWFHEDDEFPLRTDLIISWNTGLLVLVAASSLAALYLFQRMLGDRYWPHIRFLDRMAIGAPTLLAVQAAVTLIHAAVQPSLFAPNLFFGVTALGLAFAFIQVLIALSFITGVGDWAAAIALMILGPIGLLLFPVIDIFEQLLWAGIGVFVLLTGRFAVFPEHARPWFQRVDPAWGRKAVTWMRVLTGLSFVALGLGEKLWNPDLAVAFLDDNPELNFVQEYFGLEWFSNEVFALSAGLTEATIGVLLISGVLTRVVILAMWLPFNLGLPFLPPQELLGHLPIFGIMYVLLVYNPYRRHSTEPREELREEPATLLRGRSEPADGEFAP